MKNMGNGSLQIKDLFKGNKIFNVPKYQRSYAWEKENLEDFLEDLKNQRDPNINYFLGTFLFHKKDEKNSYQYIDIVDGQQRLTTTIIFLQVILELLGKKSKVKTEEYKNYIYDGECFKLEIGNEDNGFFQKLILDNYKNSKCETPSQKKILLAKNYFNEKLQELSLDTLERIYTVLTEAKIMIYVVNEISEATQIFELLNDRGKRLTSLEGIKSFLMYRIGCLNINNKEQPIEKIQNNFARIYRSVENNEINEDDVLRYHTIAFEECNTTDYNYPDKYIKNKINMMFENKENDLVIRDTIIDYIDRLESSFILYEKIKMNSIKSEGLDKLYMIGRVNPFIPLIMKIYREESSDKLELFINSICKFTFKAALVGLKNNNESFYSYIRNKKGFLDLFDKIIEENWWNINKRAEETVSFTNYYEWINKNIIKYILFSYENKLRLKQGYPLLTRENYFSEDPRMKLNIEHINAQRAKNIELSESFKNEHLNYIGNLVIDTTASNSRKGNKSVEEKKEDFLISSLMSQSEIIKSDVDWNSIASIGQFIDKRGDEIIGFIIKDLF